MSSSAGRHRGVVWEEESGQRRLDRFGVGSEGREVCTEVERRPRGAAVTPTSRLASCGQSRFAEDLYRV